MAQVPLWRLGNKIRVNVYAGDRPVCQCHSEIDAQVIVKAVNSFLCIHQWDGPRIRLHCNSAKGNMLPDQYARRLALRGRTPAFHEGFKTAFIESLPVPKDYFQL
jgi:hypothetical protein